MILSDILQVATQDVSNYAAAIEGIERMCKMVTECSIIQKLMLGNGFDIENGLELALVRLYRVMLGYLLEACRYFRRQAGGKYQFDAPSANGTYIL